MEMLRKASARIRNVGENTGNKSSIMVSPQYQVLRHVLQRFRSSVEPSCLKICKTGTERKDERKREKRHAPDWSLLDRSFHQVSVHRHEETPVCL